MKQVIRKAFWNYEKEEHWLNTMSAQGLAMTNYSWCRYVFEEAPKGEYIYRIELLGNPIDHPESQSYLRFMDETGVECVAHYLRWVYFRKKSADGAFDIYSDIDSRIRHYQKISHYWNTFTAIELAAGLLNIGFSVIYFVAEGKTSLNLFVGLPVLFLGVLFLYLGRQIRKKILALKKESRIRE